MGDDQHIRMLLAEPRPVLRGALRAVLEAEDDLRVVAEADDLVQAVDEVEVIGANVALVSLAARPQDNWDEMAQLRRRGCRIVLLTDDDDVTTLLTALEEGIGGFRTVECPLADVVATIRAVHRGETVVPQEMLGPLLGRLIRRRRDRDEAFRTLSKLTPREREVLALLTRQATNRTIAEALKISPATARTHVGNLLKKLDMHSRTEAAEYVARHELADELARM